jgi:Raf kinase inhibitor-like YbhB/YbcL family protein
MAAGAAACGGALPPPLLTAMQLSSSAFRSGESMPARFSREEGNLSPPLAFSDVPVPAQSLALIMDDPDAPRGTFTHWVVFDLDPRVGQIPENRLPGGTLGRNDWGETAYGGPRPPSGTHRYFFRAFALDQTLHLPRGAPRHEVEAAIKGHILDHAELIGRYTAAHAHA